MNRQTRRRLGVALAAAALGVTGPFWGPRLLRTVPAFRVAEIEVEGERFVAAGEALDMAGIAPDGSVWDDYREAEERLRGHPLIEDAEVRRSGFNRLTLVLVEVKAVALVATPVLSAVDARGEVLPVDPARHRIDLPVLQGADVQSGRVADEASRRVLLALERLGDLNRGFVDRVSEVRRVPGDAIELILLEGSHAGRILLPMDDADLAFLRVEDALRSCEERGRIVSADARFRGQVVVELEGDA